jgi:hypothetical protein
MKSNETAGRFVSNLSGFLIGGISAKRNGEAMMSIIRPGSFGFQLFG